MVLRYILSIALWSGTGVPVLVASPQPQDALALKLVADSLNALGGVAAFADVTVQAMATFTAGSDIENGTATLEAKGNRYSRIVLNLDGGQRQEVRRGSAGAWVGPDGQSHPIATHNTWADANWFFPALSLRAALTDPQLVAVYLGDEMRDGMSVHHVRVSRLISGPDSTTVALIRSLSTVDLYLDAASHLPAALRFNLHPDTDAGVNIAVEIRYTDYRSVNGAQVPFHIQRFLQGTLTLDLNITNVAINTGLSDSDFNMLMVQP